MAARQILVLGAGVVGVCWLVFECGRIRIILERQLVVVVVFECEAIVVVLEQQLVVHDGQGDRGR